MKLISLFGLIKLVYAQVNTNIVSEGSICGGMVIDGTRSAMCC